MNADHEPGAQVKPAEVATPDTPAWRSASAWVVLLACFATGFTLDLLSKHLAFEHVASRPVELRFGELVGDEDYIPWHEGISVIPPDLLDFHLVLNRGAVFGLGQDQRLLFICFTVIAVFVCLLVFSRWTTSRDRLAHVALGLILAGGLGNLYDRIGYGAVRDFLHMFPGRELPWGVSWPGGSREIFPWVFNVADMLLLAGMFCPLLFLHLGHRKE